MNGISLVFADEKDTLVPGLYAAGEVACVSVHGANRLGTNSLLDIIVFGKQAGIKAAEYAQESSFPNLPEEPEGFVRQQLDALRNGDGSAKVHEIREEMQEVMFDHVGVFRTEQGMEQALKVVRELKEKYNGIRVDDQGMVFNTDLLEAWELGCARKVAGRMRERIIQIDWIKNGSSTPLLS